MSEIPIYLFPLEHNINLMAGFCPSFLAGWNSVTPYGLCPLDDGQGIRAPFGRADVPVRSLPTFGRAHH